MVYYSGIVSNLRKGLLFIFFIGFTAGAYCQVNEPQSTAAYEYLYRMAQKGTIDWNDYLLPLDRKDILSALQELDPAKGLLRKTERSELKFYLKEYAFDIPNPLQPEKNSILRKDSSGRFRSAMFVKGQAKIFIDPLIGSQYMISTGDREASKFFSGIRFAGYFGKRWGINFSFRDNTEKGDTITRRNSFSPAEGFIPTQESKRLANYSSLNFNIGYRWSDGALSIGKENLSVGYGLRGNVILSGKAPSFPYIKFDYKPWSWLHFNYFHGWLHSNLIDSGQSYNTGTGFLNGRREVYHEKFLANHSITVTPVKGLDVSIGESVVYSNKLNIAYLIPINFFKIYDHQLSRYNLQAGDNAQFFGFISSRNHIKKTHLYAQLFVDEIKISRVLNEKEKRNQLGYTLGISRTDNFINYLTAGMEYSRINPFVYANLIPTQTYESHSFTLGDWMGNNADRLYVYVQYVPLPKLRIKLWHQKIRKGAAGTLQQQYFQQPQPKFMFGKLFDYKEAAMSLTYEWINRLMLFGELNRVKVNYINAPATVNSSVKLGFTYGL